MVPKHIKSYSFFKQLFSYSSLHIILFENLFKPRQRHLTVYMLLTSSVLSTTSKHCFEQPAASFLVCSLIFIEYQSSHSHSPVEKQDCESYEQHYRYQSLTSAIHPSFSSNWKDNCQKCSANCTTDMTCQADSWNQNTSNNVNRKKSQIGLAQLLDIRVASGIAKNDNRGKQPIERSRGSCC